MGDDVEEGLPVEAQRHRTPQLGFVERRDVAVYDQVAADIGRIELAERLRCLALDIVGKRHRQAPESDVELARNKRQHRRRHVADDGILEPIEIWPAGFPVVGIPGQFDRFVRLEFDEFKRAGTDRTLAHLARRHVARIDRREPGSEQRD